MNVSQALAERKSVRAFLDKPVPYADLEKILSFARYAPSGTNTQPWQVAIVSGNTKKELDNELLNAFRNNTPRNMDYKYYPDEFTLQMKHRRLACGLQMYKTLGIERGDTEKRLEQWSLNYSAFGAPAIFYIFAPKLIEKGSFMDCGMFIQSIMLMATELGLSTCAQAALAEYPSIVKNKLNYSDELSLLCGIAIGYEDKGALINSYKTPREEVSSFSKFFD